MRIIYEAIDGIQFDDKNECEKYEVSLLHPNIFSVVFYNRAGESFHVPHHNIFEDNTYESCEKIVIHNDAELADFSWITKETGWMEFYDINSPGTWVRNDFGGFNVKWEKVT